MAQAHSRVAVALTQTWANCHRSISTNKYGDATSPPPCASDLTAMGQHCYEAPKAVGATKAEQAHNGNLMHTCTA